MAKAVGSILVGNWVILLLSVLLFLLVQPLLLPFFWSSLGQGAAPCLTTGLPSQGDPRGEGPGGQEPSDGGSSTWTGSLQAVQVLKKTKPQSQTSLMEITQLGKGRNLPGLTPAMPGSLPPSFSDK